VSQDLARYALVECEVTAHQPYGVVFEVGGGLRGFVDKADIADAPVMQAEWPSVGRHMTCVVLGRSRDGRIRASMRPSDVQLARSVTDPDRSLRDWIRIRDEGFADISERDAFLASPETSPLLRWALGQRAGSRDRARAMEIVSDTPENLKRWLG
jgi:predicted RNA-binding protein with RPS1 domain